MRGFAVLLSLHIGFLLVWSASLIYLPALLMQQECGQDTETCERLMRTERWLYSHLMTPAALLAIVFGTWLIFVRGFEGGWLPVKLTLVFGMVLYHVYIGQLMVRLRTERHCHHPGYYRLLPAVPIALILPVFWLVTGKPF